MPNGDRQIQTTVVGAGIVGICCALYLQRDGHQVTVIDPNEPGTACSSGNGGQIVTAYCVPVSLPGIARQVPGMLLDPLGPLTIRWQYLPRLLPWLLRFVAASSMTCVEAIAAALYDLNKDALRAFEPLLKQAGAEHLITTKGRLDVYQSEHSFSKASLKFELMRQCGARVEMLDSKQVRELEPALGEQCRFGAFFPDTAHTTDTLGLTQMLAEDFVRRGGRILHEKVIDFQVGASATPALRTDADLYGTERIILAAGAYSRPLAARLGSKLPLDTERGYHVMLPDPGVEMRTPVKSAEGGFYMTPMELGLRVAGTDELGGLDLPPNWDRVEAMLRRVRRLVPGLNEAGAEPWMGFRPSLPDSKPVISPVAGRPGVFLAFGHGHVGLTLGAITGRVVADMVAGRPPPADMTPFSADRF